MDGVREAGQGLGGGCKGFGSGGVGGRDTGPRDGANFATCLVFLSFLTRTKRRKMAVFEGCPVGWRGGTHRSWPGGRGGRPRALVAGEGWGGRRGDGSSKEGGGLGLGWLFRRGQGRVGGGCKGFGSGGVGGRGTGPRDGANFATGVTRTKRRKMAFFEGCPVGWGGVPTGALHNLFHEYQQLYVHCIYNEKS